MRTTEELKSIGLSTSTLSGDYVVKTSKKGVQYLPAYFNTPLANSENKDCVVRALAAACNVNYDVVNFWVNQEFNRKHGKATYNFVNTLSQFSKIFDKEVLNLTTDSLYTCWRGMYTYYRQYGKLNEREMTLVTFLKRYPKGSYVLVTKNHAFAVVDSVVMGNVEDAYKVKRGLRAAFKIGS